MRKAFFAALLVLPMMLRAEESEQICVTPDKIDNYMDALNSRGGLFRVAVIFENEKWEEFKSFYQKQFKGKLPDEVKLSTMAEIYIPTHGNYARIYTYINGCATADGNLDLLGVLMFLENEKKKVNV